jgi:hypothetical protein
LTRTPDPLAVEAEAAPSTAPERASAARPNLATGRLHESVANILIG